MRGDIEEALNAASAIGDRLQKEGMGNSYRNRSHTGHRNSMSTGSEKGSRAAGSAVVTPSTDADAGLMQASAWSGYLNVA